MIRSEERDKCLNFILFKLRNVLAMSITKKQYKLGIKDD